MRTPTHTHESPQARMKFNCYQGCVVDNDIEVDPIITLMISIDSPQLGAYASGCCGRPTRCQMWRKLCSIGPAVLVLRGAHKLRELVCGSRTWCVSLSSSVVAPVGASSSSAVSAVRTSPRANARAAIAVAVVLGFLEIYKSIIYLSLSLPTMCVNFPHTTISSQAGSKWLRAFVRAAS